MTKSLSVKVHLYEVHTEGSVEIADVIANLGTRNQESRILQIAGYPTKMEDLESPKSGVWVANFCKQREIGPGKSSRGLSTTGFELEKSECFGEMTAILLTEDKKHVLVQYNHYGVRAPSIAQYLTKHVASEGIISFHPVLRRDVSMKIKLADKVGAIETALDFTAGFETYSDSAKTILKTNKTLFHAHQALANLSKKAKKISFKFGFNLSEKKGKFEGSQGIDRNLIDDLLVLNKENIVTSAKAKFYYSDGTDEFLDLLKAKEEVECNVDIADDKRMIDFEDSKKFLNQAYRSWKNERVIGK